MESSTKSTSILPFKSKKPLLSTPQKPNVGPAAVVTPDRPNPRIRNRNFALSLSDVRRATLQHLKNSQISGSDSGPEKVSRPVDRVTKVVGGSDRSGAALLPEKHEMLCEFFTALISSIRLFRLKRQSATLAKLSRSIESLTNRRFTLRHLAQLKHIVPEVIAVKKMCVRDEETNCMKEELLVSLETDAVETDQSVKGSGGFSHLKGIFRSRISDYASTHPEGDDVPEGELPDMFYKPKQEHERSVNVAVPSLSASLTSPSFRRRFSSKVFIAPDSESSPAKPSYCLPETPIKDVSAMAEQDSIESEIDITATPAKLVSTPAKCASTPAEVVSTPSRLMAATPALRTPKRSLISADDDSEGFRNNRSAKRRVMFSEVISDDAADPKSNVSEDENNVPLQCSAASKDLLSVLPESLLHSLLKKEQKTLQEQNPILLQAKRRQQLMAGAPKLFDMIQIIFQSIRRSVITKEELICKLITGHLDIVDREEVEEQLKLLQEVAPEFLSEQTSLSGDTLLRLNRASSAESVRAKLLEAK